MEFHRKLGIGFILLVLFILYYYCNPEQYRLFPKCPFLLITGYKCPGCGSQRAIHNILHFDIIKALKYNILLVLSIPYISSLIYTEYRKKKNLKLYMLIHNPRVTIGYLFIILSWWIFRNIFNL